MALLDTYTKEEAKKQEGMKEKQKKNTWATLFANDSKLSGSIKKEEDMSNLQKYIDLTLGWMSSMGMTVNGDKSYTVRCGPVKQSKTYFVSNELIKFFSNMRDLGVQFAQDGSYNDQVEVA